LWAWNTNSLQGELVSDDNKHILIEKSIEDIGDLGEIWRVFNTWDFPGGSDSKESACQVRDQGLIPGSGRCPGERNGNPLQYSCLENSMDRGTCPLATVHTVTSDRT